MKPFRLGVSKIEESLKLEGLKRKSFTVSSEGRYSSDDADWNYKDIPHLKMVHKLINNHLVVGENYFLTSIAFQKILGIFKIPLCLINYDYDESTQIYYTSFLFYILVIETRIIKVEENFTKVETTYNIFGGNFMPIFFWAIRFLLIRNYKNLMADDIPMRNRRGWLRDQGYKFTKVNEDQKYTYLETARISEKHVYYSGENKKIFHYSIPLDHELPLTTCVGDSGSTGFRIEHQDGRLYIYPRMCNHEGADLTCADKKGANLICPWHGKMIEPIAILDSNVNQNVSKYEINISLKRGQNLLIESANS
jgi:hypothetical protein